MLVSLYKLYVLAISGLCALGITRDRSITEGESCWPWTSDSWANATSVYGLVENSDFETLLSIDQDMVIPQETDRTNLSGIDYS
jgi:hypothetical protein